MDHISEILANCIQYQSKDAYVSSDGGRCSYTTLLQYWEDLKCFLLDIKFNSQKRIGILINSKEKGLQCIGGILLSNNVYVPLDFDAPLHRNIHIIQDNMLHGLFIESHTYDDYKSNLPDHKVSPLEDFIFLTFESTNTPNFIPINLAYILNTSGSTGRPKGVMISHLNALTFINWASSHFEFRSTDKFTSIAPFHFDLSIFDIYVCLHHGASVLLLEPSDIKNPLLLAKLISDSGITVLYATPTVLMLLLRYGKLHKYDYSNLRYVFFAGEVFPIQPLKQLKAAWSHVEFYNWYGPTETNVCTFYKIPSIAENQETPFPIGESCISNTTFVAPDGELLVSGDGVAAGYWNNDSKNQSSFIEDEDNVRWYKTGDLVSIDNSGNYVYRGRKDRMIKRRGYRIELDELEHLVRGLSEIQDSAVLSTINDKNELCIICFFTSKEGNAIKLSASEIRDYLLGVIPAYMLPDSYIHLDLLPKTSTHKTDYQALVSKYLPSI